MLDKENVLLLVEELNAELTESQLVAAMELMKYKTQAPPHILLSETAFLRDCVR